MGKSGGISQSTQDAEVQVAQGELALGQQANQRASQLFSETFPGLAESENYYQQLASGDPAAIARAIAPATQQINAQAQGAAQRITQDVPRGGAQNLALAENQINKGAQISNAATQGYLNSFQNLAALAGQGVGEAGSFTNSAIGGLSAAGNQYSNIANQQAEGKATQLGFIASLAGSGAEAVGAFCWVAEELFGKDSYETLLIRKFLRSRTTPLWKAFCAMYQKHGERFAEEIRHAPWKRAAAQFVFERIYRMAQRVVPDEDRRKIFESYWKSRLTYGR